MARRRYVIRNMPLRGSLTTAGQQGTIPETQLWRATNVTAALDGTMSKRPGLEQWGQTLKQPNGTDDFTFYEMFNDLGNWSITESGMTFTYNNNKLIANMPFDDGGLNIWSGTATLPASGTVADSDDEDFSFRFTCQAVNISGSQGVIVSVRSRTSDDMLQLTIGNTGITVRDSGGGETTVTSDSIGDLAAFSVEIQHDADGNTLFYVNDTLELTLASSSLGKVADVSSDYVKISLLKLTADEGNYTVYFSDMMMDGAADGLTAERLGANTDFKTVIGGTSSRRYVLVAGTKYVYRDADLKRYWSPLLALGGGEVSYAQFVDDLLIFDADSGVNSRVYRWSGTATPPELLDDAPPVRFGTEHRLRVFAAGDKRFPLRLYFTAAGDPTVWFAPESDSDGQETIDEVTNAGYINIPGEKGDEIVSVNGEFYGSCVVCTNRGIWRITGSTPLSYVRENITTSIGSSAQAGLERMGNDLWLAGRQGVTTIATVQQFGDMKTAMPSATIADLWAQGISNGSIKVDQRQMFRASMAWNPTLSLMYFAFARLGASDVSSIMVYNPVTQGWYGPWESTTTYVSQVEIGNPIIQAVMHSTSEGKVGITDPNYKADFGEQYDMKIESPYLCGRSVDPSLTHQVKTWRTLRLFFNIRGDWPITVRWQVDNETYEQSVEYCNPFNMPRLGTDWRIGVDPDGIIHSQQLIGVIEIPIDQRGRYFKFDITTSGDEAGEDFVPQGYEVEFTAGGSEEQQES